MKAAMTRCARPACGGNVGQVRGEILCLQCGHAPGERIHPTPESGLTGSYMRVRLDAAIFGEPPPD